MKTRFTGLAGSLRIALFAGAAVAALSLPAAALAQQAEEEAQPAADAPAAEEQGAEDGNAIVVTATKRERTLQDVPVAVSVTTGETIQRAQIRDLKDLQSLVPALRVSQLQSSANTNFIIRGFGNGANNAGIEPSVGVFVDGVYRSRTASQIGDLPDVSRVEVLRGPQSTLFGKNASAGVISMITRAPQFKFGGNVEASYGNYNAIVLKGVVTGPLTETIAASLAGGINKRDGYNNDLGYNGEGNNRDRWFVRGQMLFEPNDALKIRLIGDYDKINEVCCSVVNLRRSGATAAIESIGGKVNDFRTPFDGTVYSNFPSTNDIRNWGFSGQIDYELGPLKLTSISAYRKSEALTNQDSDFTSADLIGENIGRTDIDTFTQELRLATDLDGPFNLLLGGYYFDESVNTGGQLTFGKDFRKYTNILSGGAVSLVEQAILGLPANTFHQVGQGVFENFTLKDKAVSVFGNVDFEITNGVTLTLGANYTDDKKTATTNANTTDLFSKLDFVTIGGAVIRNSAIATTVGTALGLPGQATAAQIGAFAGAQPAIYSAIVAGATAFANANATNPAVNPLLGLRALQFLPQFLNYPNAVESGKTHDNKWTWTARLAFDVTDTVNAYVSYATGFKASSINLSRDSRPLASDLSAIRLAGIAPTNLSTGTRFAAPEYSTVYEFGLKANWGIASANLAVFKQSIKGFQSNIFTGTGFGLANAGKESAFGFEFDGMVKPTDELTLTMAMTYLKPKYDDFTNSTLGDASGKTPAGIPEISATWGAQWNKPLGNGDRLIVRGDFHYETDTQIADGLPGFIQRNALGQVITYQPAFDAARPFRREVADVNASITYALESGLELSVWGRNLTDNRYISTIFDSVAQSGSISGYTSPPRTYGVGVRYKF